MAWQTSCGAYKFIKKENGVVKSFDILNLRFKIMATFHRFEDLEIWETAKKLSLKVIKLTEVGPSFKDFKFRNQIRSSAGSVMDNIAEGFESSL